jgi:hypothetical protein
MEPRLFNIRETVVTVTPALSATSLIVAIKTSFICEFYIIIHELSFYNNNFWD